MHSPKPLFQPLCFFIPPTTTTRPLRRDSGGSHTFDLLVQRPSLKPVRQSILISTMEFAKFTVLCIVCLSAFLVPLVNGAGVLPASEVSGLRNIARSLGKTNWNFSVDPCSGKAGWVTVDALKGAENNVTCDCTYVNNSVCHIVAVFLKMQNLPGILPPEFAQLPYLQELDLTRNYLNGSIPREWASLPLVNLSLIGNRISGTIPVELTTISTLKAFTLEYNLVSGSLPAEIGNMTNLERLLISSNRFTGPLPETLAKLTNMKDFRISDNQFTGRIPSFIQNWTNLTKIAIQASGLQGPIPSEISVLTKLTDMRISDLNGTDAPFPPVSNMEDLKSLVLKSCNIVGSLPAYLGNLTALKYLDLSFNKLTGPIPSSFFNLLSADYMYFTGNRLTGSVPEWMLKEGDEIDLSYNNFTMGDSGASTCQQRNVNLFGSSSLGNTTSGVVPCLNSFSCPKEINQLHINCGGREVSTSPNTIYEEDRDSAGASKYFLSRSNWAFSSTGNFLDKINKVDVYIATNTSILSMKDSQLYMTARLSPLSLTYYGLCMLKGNYTVNLHFAEIMFTDDRTYSSLGRRIFDIYIQGRLVQKDFNIADEAGGASRAVIKSFTATVTNTTLEIRLYWAGKGTAGIPSRGTYGPLISAISVTPNLEPPTEDGKKISPGLVAGIVLLALGLIVMILFILWWKGCIGRRNQIDKGNGSKRKRRSNGQLILGDPIDS